MKDLSELLAKATAGIEPGYFRLAIYGGAPVYRERVYCYELYHQMRLRWPNPSAFMLNGEVDKAGHAALIKLGAGGYKPDLLVHSPGDMNGNHAIIEVKPAVGVAENCGKDLNTLVVFKENVGYARAIYLVYGEDISNRLIDRIDTTYKAMNTRVPIELWLHGAPHEEAFNAKLIRPADDHSDTSDFKHNGRSRTPRQSRFE